MSRVRTDMGGENVLIWQFMEEIRGDNRGSALRGTSTQNQRIERLWRDVFRCVACNFYYLFQSMESLGILDTNNDIHIYILHYVFTPRINRCIDSFVAAWNNHPMRTEHSWSPKKMWQNGMIDLRNRNLNVVQSLLHEDMFLSEEDMTWYGFDSEAPLPNNGEYNQVEVEDIDANFDFDLLRDVNPLRLSNNMGIDIYIGTMDIIYGNTDENIN